MPQQQAPIDSRVQDSLPRSTGPSAMAMRARKGQAAPWGGRNTRQYA